MSQPLECIVCGNLVADIIGRPVNALVPNHHGGPAKLDEIRLFTGGFGCNAAIDLARLGVRTGLIGRVGDDEWRNMMVQALKSHGVDLTGLVTDPTEQTSATIVCVDSTGERSFYHTLGAQKNLCAADLLSRADYLGQAKVLAFGYYGLLPRLDLELPAVFQSLKKQYGIQILLDTCGSIGPVLSDLAQTLPWVDFFIPSYHEAKILTGRTDPVDMVKAFRDSGALSVVGIKLGGDGCLLDDGHRRVRARALAVERVVDTTGAGDSFLAGIVTGHLRGMDLEQMACFANAVGSCCVQALGASTGIRSYADTLKLLR